MLMVGPPPIMIHALWQNQNEEIFGETSAEADLTRACECDPNWLLLLWRRTQVQEYHIKPKIPPECTGI
jgi:hypothetical protein